MLRIRLFKQRARYCELVDFIVIRFYIKLLKRDSTVRLKAFCIALVRRAQFQKGMMHKEHKCTHTKTTRKRSLINTVNRTELYRRNRELGVMFMNHVMLWFLTHFNKRVIVQRLQVYNLLFLIVWFTRGDMGVCKLIFKKYLARKKMVLFELSSQEPNKC